MSVPRRIQVEKLTPAERAIFDAMCEVEKLPPDVRLTRAVVLLAEAKDRVGDFVDGVEWKPPANMLEAAPVCAPDEDDDVEPLL